MKDLLLNRALFTSKSRSDEIRVIARTETLSAMRQLDGKRNQLSDSVSPRCTLDWA